MDPNQNLGNSPTPDPTLPTPSLPNAAQVDQLIASTPQAPVVIPPQPRSYKGIIIGSLVVVVLLGVGGGAAFWFMQQKPLSSVVSSEKSTPDVKVETQKETSSEVTAKNTLYDTDMKARAASFAGNLNGYFEANSFYPTTQEVKDESWLTHEVGDQTIDKNDLMTPDGRAVNTTADYTYVASQCESDGCKSYAISAKLSNGKFEKSETRTAPAPAAEESQQDQ